MILRVAGVQVGRPSEIREPGDTPWVSAIFKQPVAGPVRFTGSNLAGDEQADLRVHGGPDKAICAYPAVHYPAWREELSEPGMTFGGFGENLTLEGGAEPDVCIGDVYAHGTLRAQVSQPRQPCWKLARRWGRPDFVVVVQETGRTGWYFRVLQDGWIAADAELRLVERPNPGWPVARANDLVHHQRGDLQTARELAGCSGLSASWREALLRRIGSG